MNPGSNELERLISRYLDDEATWAERRELRVLLDADPHAAALMDEHEALDRELGRAIRQAMGHGHVLPVGRSVWAQFRQFAALAAAACLAVMIWTSPPRQAAQHGEDRPSQTSLSWFAPETAPADVVPAVNVSYERPRERRRHTDRDWIIIPGERPGVFLVIEVNRVRTCAIAIQDDF